MSELNDNKKILFNILADTLNGRETTEEISDIPSLWKEAQLQAVSLVAFKNVDLSNQNERTKNIIHGEIKRLLARNITVALAHSEVSSVLAVAGIPHCIIKGCACGMYYPDYLLRSLGDVDFIVKPEFAEKAHRVLIENGFSLVTDKHKFHSVYIKNGVRFEMHSEPAGVPEGDKREKCLKYFDDITEKAALRQTPYGNMYLPSLFHHGLVILLHSIHHLQNSGIGLRQLCDWAVFIQSITDEVYLSTFESCFRSLGIWRYAKVLTRICEKYLGLEKRSFTVGVNENTVDALAEDIFDGGNLGQKNIARSQSAYLIIAGTGEQSKIKRLIKTAVDIVYLKWRKAKKHKILLPFGILYFGLRRCYRMATGKRPKLKIREAVKDADIRNTLYSGLHLFETKEQDL